MNDLVISDTGALTISDSDRIRIAAAWEALSVNSRRSYQGSWDRCGQWLTDRDISLDDLSDELMAVYIFSRRGQVVLRKCAERGTELADNGKQVAVHPSRLKDKGTRTGCTPNL